MNHEFKKYFHEHSHWLSKHITILLISTILGAICGLVMIVFNYVLILFKIGYSFIPYFLTPLIAGALTSIIVKIGMKNKFYLIIREIWKSLFGVIFYPEYPEFFILLGISSILTTSIKNPIAAIIILVEMT